jgi:hypothetical protein
VPASRFSTIWKSSSASSATTSHLPTSAVFVKNKIDVTSERYQQYIDADIRNILPKKATQIELVAQLLNMVSNRHYLPCPKAMR